ncbi:hypothetical protein Isop_0539 [Isosphaera pallida ATCC 43644]|uniref:Uncharacterized protein n=1 Tax=Isosphaera pallida (strain ATCC 43644 / DSM 9630 / IS1B) TaxID=575540 RepID=E8R014_ISOPI|nr:hypothetical protein [Isosphaera pallida]ADV61132.1 hypothetical protein Isop_0539 [Isosphaera pallida ATCC 43644]
MTTATPHQAHPTPPARVSTGPLPPDQARRVLVRGLAQQRIARPSPTSARHALSWALEMTASGESPPPINLVADLGHLILGTDEPEASSSSDRPPSHYAAGLTPASPSPSYTALVPFYDRLIRRYDDLVIGKFLADPTFQRGAEAVRHYPEADRVKGVAYLIARIVERAGIQGPILSPAALRSLAGLPNEIVRDLLDTALEPSDDPNADAHEWAEEARQLDTLTHAIRDMGEVLAPEDLFELEERTALEQFGQRIALRQTVAMIQQFLNFLHTNPPRPSRSIRRVATRLLEEDAYPVGGFASLSNRGSLESLLHSQLAFMEPPDSKTPRPDLFDIKFVRDELLYYARDENAFYRRHRATFVLLRTDLTRARIKDPGSPRQRIILLLAFLVATIRAALERLGEESLVFEVIPPLTEDGSDPLDQERLLLARLLRDQIANRTVIFAAPRPIPALVAHIDEAARRSLVTVWTLGCSDPTPNDPDAPIALGTPLGGSSSVTRDSVIRRRLIVSGPVPLRSQADGSLTTSESDDASVLEQWQHTLREWLNDWL